MKTNDSILFSPGKIGGITIKNRFVRSATWAGLADDQGGATPALMDLMENLARGGAGLIITGHAYVHPSGRHAPGQLGIHTDAGIKPMRALTEARCGNQVARRAAIPA